MSNSVVAAAAVSRAKHLVPNKKVKKHAEDQKAAHEEQQADGREHQSTHVVQTGEANSHASVVDGSMSGEFSFASALAGAAQDSASLSGFAQDGGSGSSDEGSGGSGTLLAIGAVGLVGAGVAVLASGGGSKEENVAPTFAAATQAVTTNEDTAKVITATATDANQGDVLTYTVPATGTGAPTKGTVTVGANGALTYTPNANANGTDSFVVTVKDQDGLSATQTINVTITPVDDAPLADAGNSTAVTLAEDAVSVPFVISYTDPDTGNATGLTLSTVTGATNGTWVSNASGNFYTPNANFNGTDSITYKVTDSTGASTTHTVTFTVTPVNDAPVTAETQAVTTAAGVAAAITVTATDVDGDTLTYAAGTGATGPAHGTVVAGATAGTFTYTPTAGFVGTDAFTVTVSDGNGGTDTHVVNVTIGDPVTITSIDVGLPSNPTPVTLDAASGKFNFTDSAATATNVFITHFTADDVITATGLASSAFSFTTGTGATGTNDLIITSPGAGVGKESIIVLEDALINSGPVFNLQTALNAVGHNFITFA